MEKLNTKQKFLLFFSEKSLNFASITPKQKPQQKLLLSQNNNGLGQMRIGFLLQQKVGTSMHKISVPPLCKISGFEI